jgi:hypothetical protein
MTETAVDHRQVINHYLWLQSTAYMIFIVLVGGLAAFVGPAAGRLPGCYAWVC